IFVNWLDNLSYLQKVMTNDLNKLEPNKALYTFMCQEDGGTIDDLLVYMLDEHSYMLVVNAANTDKDLAWLEENVESEEVSIQRSEERRVGKECRSRREAEKYKKKSKRRR